VSSPANQIAYVVAATPRSGTQYVAEVLTRLGLNCSHEKYFFFDRDGKGFPDGSAVCGESSSHAAPHLPKTPEHVVVFHQVRNPVRVIQSHLDLGWLSNKSVAARAGVLKFFRHFSGWRDFDKYSTALERAAWFWHDYNLMIERNAQGRRYVRYRLEDLDGVLLARLISALDLPPPSRGRISVVLHGVSRRTNRRIEEKQKAAASFIDEPRVASWDVLPSPVAQLAARYGYDHAGRAPVDPDLQLTWAAGSSLEQ
jgi:hypothetical protein